MSYRQSHLGVGGGGDSDAASVKYPELVTVFKEASRNFLRHSPKPKLLFFRDIEDAKTLKTIGAYTESTGLISCDTVPLSYNSQPPDLLSGHYL